jgi:hypothetical protein
MPPSALASTLRLAGCSYGAAAKAITAKLGNPAAPSAIESERLIAFGIASDWTRRAAALSPLHYSALRMRNSRNAHSVSEMVRFNLSWSGMNAIFSRNSIFSLIGIQPPTSELKRFKALLAASNLPSGLLQNHLSALHAILQATTTSRVPGLPPGQNPTLQVIHLKYTPVQYQHFATGTLISGALSSGNFAALDVPTLIYLMRNWSVHGGIIGSSFRSVPRFRHYIATISDALAQIHAHVAKHLQLAASAP